MFFEENKNSFICAIPWNISQHCFASYFSDAGAGSASVGLGFGGSYGQERQCILAEYGGLSENDLRRDENYDVWEYRGGGNCRNYRNGMIQCTLDLRLK